MNNDLKQSLATLVALLVGTFATLLAGILD